MNRKNVTVISAILLVLFGFALRLYQLDAVPLRGDEAFSALNWAGIPLQESLARIATIEPFPPLNYVLFRTWGLIFGIENVLLLRMLGVLANTLGIVVVFALGKFLGGRKVGLIAAFLWAIHPFLIWHAQDFRTYAIWSTMSTFSLWLGLRLARYRRPVDWGLYALIAMMTALLFYNELFFMVALSIAIVIRYGLGEKQWRWIARWLGLQIIIYGITLLFFGVLQGQVIGSGVYGGTASNFDLSRLLQEFTQTLSFGETVPNLPLALWLPLLGLYSIAFVLLYRKKPSLAASLSMMIVIPVIILSIASTQLDIFRPRYILPVTPILILLLANTLVMISRRQQYVGLIVVGIWVSVSLLSLNNYYHNSATYKAPDWASFGRHIMVNIGENDLVIQRTVDAAFGYYVDIPGCDPDGDLQLTTEETCGIGLPYSPTQPTSDIQVILDQVADSFERVWVVLPDPGWENGQYFNNWAASEWQLIDEQSIAGLPVKQYLPNKNGASD